jgi:hypothetical protein
MTGVCNCCCELILWDRRGFFWSCKSWSDVTCLDQVLLVTEKPDWDWKTILCCASKSFAQYVVPLSHYSDFNAAGPEQVRLIGLERNWSRNWDKEQNNKTKDATGNLKSIQRSERKQKQTNSKRGKSQTLEVLANLKGASGRGFGGSVLLRRGSISQGTRFKPGPTACFCSYT